MMRDWSIDKREITCVYTYNACTGSLTYNFDTGELLGNKPSTLSNLDWFKQIKNFMSVCKRMIDTEIG